MSPFQRRHYESQSCWLSRFIYNLLHAIVESKCCKRGANRYNNPPNNLHRATEENSGEDKQQYKLHWKTTQKSSLPCLSCRQRTCWMLSRTTLRNGIDETGTSTPSFFLGLNINYMISSYLSWTFRTSYLLLFGAFGIFYFTQILIFALLYLLIASMNAKCITSGGVPIGSVPNSYLFSDCFHLSWTTFSTVGYGLIYPATGAEEFDVSHACVGLGVLGSFEAFMGILYTGFCGAILFGKVVRSQSNAQVYFSDPIVVRYGKEELGVGSSSSSSSGGGDGRRGQCDIEMIAEEDEEEAGEVIEKMNGEKEDYHHDDDEENGNNTADGGIPCPSLEFRLMNRLHGIVNGEIVEAKLNCVAILDPKLCNEDILESVNKSKNANDPSSILSDNNNGSSSNSVASSPIINEQTTISELAKVLEQQSQTHKSNNKVFTFHAHDSKQPRIFCKLTLDTEEHPFFRRVWFGRHRLDENSPLLTEHARNRVKENGGYWPADMNNYRSIKKSLHFRHILVCISGTSNANAASVYAQKVYDLVDVNVGYRFVPMNYHDEAQNGMLKTDSHLLNAVYEQRGGGSEPFA